MTDYNPKRINRIQILPGDELPEGWVRAKLPQIVTIKMGQSPPGSSYNRRGNGIPFFQGKADFGDRYPRVRVWCTEPQKFAEPGDVLISVRAPVGPTNIADRLCAIGRGLAALTPFGGISPVFILFALRLIEPALALAGTGSTFTAINHKILEEIDIDVPPLAEQKRIVAKVEELLGRINSVWERLARVQAILKRFRQSVLSAACSGRLTADWREKQAKVTPVDDSIRKILRQREKEWFQSNRSAIRYKPPENININDFPELPGNWKYISSDALLSFITSGSRGWAKYYAESGPIFIRVGNLDHASISLDLRDVQYVNPPNGQEKDRTRVQPGDILISITADVGMISLVRSDVGEAFVNQHVAIARPVKCVFRPYLAWFLAAQEGGQKQFQNLQRGATKVGLGLDDIKSIAVPFPPIEEQQEIASRIDALFKLADNIEKRVRVADSWSEKSTQAILAKAFRGELVPTEADLARREGRSYEPASALLAKINEERDIGSPPVSKKQKRRL
jgi:type I restriction enzyme S subunit